MTMPSASSPIHLMRVVAGRYMESAIEFGRRTVGGMLETGSPVTSGLQPARNREQRARAPATSMRHRFVMVSGLHPEGYEPCPRTPIHGVRTGAG